MHLEIGHHSKVSTRYTIEINPLHGANDKFWYRLIQYYYHDAEEVAG
jgi:hypothetical protein